MPTVPRSTDYGPSTLGLRDSSPALAAQIGGAANIQIGESLSQVGQMLTQGGIHLQEQMVEQHRRDKIVQIRTEASRRSNEMLLGIMKDPGDLETAMDRFRSNNEQILQDLTGGLDTEMATRARESLIPHLESQAQNLQLFIFDAAKDYSKETDLKNRQSTALEVFAARRRGEDDYADNLIKEYATTPRMFFSKAQNEAATYDLQQTEETLNMNDQVGEQVRLGNFDQAFNIAEDNHRFPHIDPNKQQDAREYIFRAAHSANSAAAKAADKAAKESVKFGLNAITRQLTHYEIAINSAQDPIQRAQLQDGREQFRKEALDQMDSYVGTASPGQFNTVMTALTQTSKPENDPIFGSALISQVMNDPGISIDEKQESIDDARLKGNIDDSHWTANNEILRRQREADHYKPPLYQQRMVDRIKASFAAGLMNPDPAGLATRKADSINEFLSWVDQHPRASESDMAEQTRTILQKHGASMAVPDYSLPQAAPSSLLRIYDKLLPNQHFDPTKVTQQMIDLSFEAIKNDPNLDDNERNRDNTYLHGLSDEMQRSHTLRTNTRNIQYDLPENPK